jgi:hypothetical protein
VHGVEHLGGNQVPRQEHARASECRRPPPAGRPCGPRAVGRRHQVGADATRRRRRVEGRRREAAGELILFFVRVLPRGPAWYVDCRTGPGGFCFKSPSVYPVCVFGERQERSGVNCSHGCLDW